MRLDCELAASSAGHLPPPIAIVECRVDLDDIDMLCQLPSAILNVAAGLVAAELEAEEGA